MNESKQKRSRLPNFTIAEESLLIELAEQHANVIENRNPDSHTWESKRRVWNEIDDELTKKFGLRRGAKNIKEKYENLKRKVRKSLPEELYETQRSLYKRKEEENLEKVRLKQEHNIEKRLAAIIRASGDVSTNDAYNEALKTKESKHELYTDDEESITLDDPIQNPLEYLENITMQDIMEAEENDSMLDSESQDQYLEPDADTIEREKRRHTSESQDYAAGQNTSEPKENEPTHRIIFSRKKTQKKNMKSNFQAIFKNEKKGGVINDQKNSTYENHSFAIERNKREAEMHSFAVERNKREAEKHKLEVEKLQWEIKESKLRAKILKQKLEKTQRSNSASPAGSIMSDSNDFPIDIVTNNSRLQFSTREEIKSEPDLHISNEDDLILPDTLNAHKRLAECDAYASEGPCSKKRARSTQNNRGDQTQWELALQNDGPYVINNDESVHNKASYLPSARDFDYNNSDDDEDAGVCHTLHTSGEVSQQTPLKSKTAQTNDASDECIFLKLLTKYKLHNYSVKLKEIHIELDCLKYVNEGDIKDIFERDIGARIRFRALVEDWRTSHMDINAIFSQKLVDKTDIVTKKDIAELKSFIKNAFLQEQQKTRELIQLATQEQTIQCNQENIIRSQPYKAVLPKKQFDTVLDFKNFEETITNSEVAHNNLINELINQPAKDSVGFIKSCWRRIMTDNVAKNFCWTGTPEKPAIRELQVTSALREAYLRKYQYASMDEFHRTIISFFQYAKVRLQKKENYEKVKTATSINVIC